MVREQLLAPLARVQLLAPLALVQLLAPLAQVQLLAPLAREQLLAPSVREQLLAPSVRNQLLAPPALVALLAMAQHPHVPCAMTILLAINGAEEDLVSLSLRSGIRMGEGASGSSKLRHTVELFLVQRRIASSRE